MPSVRLAAGMRLGRSRPSRGGVKPRLLLLSPYLPFPGVPHGGGQRVVRLLRALRDDFDVDVLCYCNEAERSEIAALERLVTGEARVLPHEQCVRWPLPPGWVRKARHLFLPSEPDHVLAFHSAELRAELSSLTAARRYAAVLVEFYHMARFVFDLRPGPLKVLDTVEVRSDYLWHDFAVESRPLWKTYQLSQYLKTRRFERSAYRLFNVVVAVSEPDRRRLEHLPPERLLTVPNGVLLEDFPYLGVKGTPRRPDTLLFVGNFAVAHNVEGLGWFCREVLPLVRARRPACRLKVAASNVPPEVAALRQPGVVEIEGPFKDLRPASWEARVSVAPILLEIGMKVKIPEAMAFGLPVVATPQAAAAIGGEALLVAQAPKAFAGHVVRLLEDDDLAERHSRLGRAQVEAQFDFRKNVRPLVERLLEARPQSD